MTSPVDDVRFAFGANWRSFLNCLTEERIADAVRCMQELLLVDSLRGMSFLDIGCGSGLHSLAASRMGAKVTSFDYDDESVACTEVVREKWAEGTSWDIEQGSVLDQSFLQGLGRFDYVYSWGVLHHTGDMWRAMANIVPVVRDQGALAIAIYNDQQSSSTRWWRLKHLYNRSGPSLRFMLVLGVLLREELWTALAHAIRLQNPLPFKRWREYQQSRGMSKWHDYVDWVGGFPFEVATPEAVFRFYRDRGFELENLTTTNGYGNNEFVFRHHRRGEAGNALSRTGDPA